MKEVFSQIVMAVLLVALICGCGPELDFVERSFRGEKAEAAIEKGNLYVNFTHEAGMATVELNVSHGWTVSFVNSRAREWCSFSTDKAIGTQGIITLKISVQENLSDDERSASILLSQGGKERTIVVTQKPEETLLLSGTSFDVGNEGGRITLSIIANVDYSYVVSEDAKQWIVLVSSKNFSTSSLVFDVLKNETEKKREGTITVTGAERTETVHIYQSSEKPTLVLSKNLYAIDSEGGTFDISVKSNLDVHVNIPYDCTWVREFSSKSVSTNVFSFVVDENDSALSREGTIDFTCDDPFMKESVRVVQVGDYQLFATSIKQYTIGADGGEIAIDVSSSEGITVMIEGASSWIQWVETKSVMNHKYLFHVLKNETASVRWGNICFLSTDGSMTEKIEVWQDCQSIFVSNDVSPVSCRGGFIRMKTRGNNLSDYKIEIRDEWITLLDSHSENDGCVFVFSIAANANARTPRSGEIRFYYQTETKPEYVFITQYEKMPSLSYTIKTQGAVAPVLNDGGPFYYGFIDWGDGCVEDYAPGLVHSYSNDGEHTIVLEIRQPKRVRIPFGANMKVDFSNFVK